ncbi:MAG: zinc finger Ran-binding domain-containing protein [Firmicutes bacterium]|nr:zinc finger Ran-binding domain-containing protein [Bacillota bacterium]
MSDESSFDFNILSGLRNAIGRECPSCGEVNPSTAMNCEFCGSHMPMDDEEDEPSLSFLHAEGVAGHGGSEGSAGMLFRYLPELEKCMTILSETIDLAKEAAISYSDYYDSILKVYNSANVALDYIKSNAVRDYISSLDEDSQRIANQVVSAFEVYSLGCKRMLEYDGGGDGVAVVDGFLKAEKSIKTIKDAASKLDITEDDEAVETEEDEEAVEE